MRLKIVANVPEAYSVRVQVRDPHDYRVPDDGRVTIDVPAYRAECGVYLFGKLPVPNHSDPYAAKTVELFANGKTARRLSLKKLYALRLDADGYHLLNLRPGKTHKPSSHE